MHLMAQLRIPAAIISADAFQVYRELNAGTNKSSLADRQRYQHYFIDHKSVVDEWNVSIFCQEAKQVLTQLFANKILPIVCGGSHLYADALINNYTFGGQIGARSEKQYINLANDEIYDALLKLDATAANKIGRNNRRRLIRALQVCQSGSQNKTNLDIQHDAVYDVFRIICYAKNRNDLYERINLRTNTMLKNNWRQEVEWLIKQYPLFLNMPAARAVGYTSIANSILQNIPIDEQLISQQIRNLAKRQLSWCRIRYPENNKKNYWFDPFEDSLDDLRKAIIYFLKN